MSRGAGSYRDPTQRRAAPEFALDQLAAVLETVSGRERGVILMRYGLLDDEPKTLAEIGRYYKVSRERIRQIERHVMSKLRHPSRSQVLRDYLDDDIARLPDHVRARILREFIPPPPAMAQCDRHGWFRPSISRPTCDSCPCPVPARWTGRPSSHCSSACRPSGI